MTLGLAPDGRQKLVVVCPVYNEEAVIPLFFARLKPVIEGISDRYATDLVFLNNASTDRSLEEIRRIRETNPFVYVATLSRNCGYQRSVECGLRTAEGDLYLVIDVDCEDPPEMIPRFLEEIAKGADIVYGERVDRPEGAMLKGMRKAFYRVTRALADEDIILDMAEFALITREVRDAINQDTSSFPFIRASIGRVGFRRVGIPYRREHRIAGETHYNFVGMTIFAVAGILSSSTLLLRLPAYLFPLWALAIVMLASAYAGSGDPAVLAGLAVAFALYVGGTAMVVAIYVARLYKNTLGRPNSILDLQNCILQPRSSARASDAR
jgi:dolichol-phosphate mannosyltransferase